MPGTCPLTNARTSSLCFPQAAASQIELGRENVSKSAGTLGPNAAGTQYAYLSLAMVNAGLTSVGFLGDYPQLQKLDLRDNQIKGERAILRQPPTDRPFCCDHAPARLPRHPVVPHPPSPYPDPSISDLAPLADLADLVWVDASENRLTECLPFKRETNIVEADLSRNEIADIGDLSAHTSLERLSLHSNQLAGITGLGFCTRLTALDLSNNSIRDLSFVPFLILFLTHLSALCRAPHDSWRCFIRGRTSRMLMSACNPMVCPLSSGGGLLLLSSLPFFGGV